MGLTFGGSREESVLPARVIPSESVSSCLRRSTTAVVSRATVTNFFVVIKKNYLCGNVAVFLFNNENVHQHLNFLIVII